MTWPESSVGGEPNGAEKPNAARVGCANAPTRAALPAPINLRRVVLSRCIPGVLDGRIVEPCATLARIHELERCLAQCRAPVEPGAGETTLQPQEPVKPAGK